MLVLKPVPLASFVVCSCWYRSMDGEPQVAGNVMDVLKLFDGS